MSVKGDLVRTLPPSLQRRLVRARRRFRALPARTRLAKRRLLGSASLAPWERALLAGVSDRIDVDDDMYAGNLGHYLGVGLSAIRCIDDVLARRPEHSDVRRILDLPSGAGRVLRFLARRFPDAEITACDLQREAVDFCAEEFGAHPLYSSRELKNVSVQKEFDLIWCGSLVTHLDTAGTRDLLRLLARSLAPAGLLVITTHGDHVASRMPAAQLEYGLTREQVATVTRAYASDGHGYVDYPGRHDYGVSLTSPAWMRSLVRDAGGLREVSFEPRGWDRHQDVFGFIAARP